MKDFRQHSHRPVRANKLDQYSPKDDSRSSKPRQPPCSPTLPRHPWSVRPRVTCTSTLQTRPLAPGSGVAKQLCMQSLRSTHRRRCAPSHRLTPIKQPPPHHTADVHHHHDACATRRVVAAPQGCIEIATTVAGVWTAPGDAVGREGLDRDALHVIHCQVATDCTPTSSRSTVALPSHS
jgi:hypothetical protein